jgi:DNA-binding transcriptional ArsR family regulator
LSNHAKRQQTGWASTVKKQAITQQPCHTPSLCYEAQAMRALADPTRLAILQVLANEPYCVSSLAQTLQLSQPTVSRHLRILHDLLLVSARRQGQNVLYELSDRRIIKAIALLCQALGDTSGKLTRHLGATQ